MGRHRLVTCTIPVRSGEIAAEVWQPRRQPGRHRQQPDHRGHTVWATVTTSAFLAVGSQLVAPISAAAHPVEQVPAAPTPLPAQSTPQTWSTGLPEIDAAIDRFTNDHLAATTPPPVYADQSLTAATGLDTGTHGAAATTPTLESPVPGLSAAALAGATPWIEPTATPSAVSPVDGTVTSSFGPRWGEVHAGVDIANEIGTPVYAAASGTVIESGPASGFGLWIQLQHPDGSTTTYGHIDETFVAVGQQVSAGDQIATVGNRGQSTGPHLHFETTNPNGDKTDPFRWLAARGVAQPDSSRV